MVGVVFGSLEVGMKQISLGKLRARRAPGRRGHLITRLVAMGAAAISSITFVLTLVLAGAAVVSAGEEATGGSGDGEILICVREQNALGGYGPERCLATASLAAGFGPASSWIGDNRDPGQAATVQRLRNSYAARQFAALDLEKTARAHAPIAIWLLSYNIKDLATAQPAPEEYWTLMMLRQYQSIGLSVLDPGIERNPTGLKALGLRISLPY